MFKQAPAAEDSEEVDLNNVKDLTSAAGDEGGEGEFFENMFGSQGEAGESEIAEAMEEGEAE